MSITIRSALKMAAPALALCAAAPLAAQDAGDEPQRVRVRLEKRNTDDAAKVEIKEELDLRSLINRAVKEALGEAKGKTAQDGERRAVRIEKRIENGGEEQVRVWVNGEEVDGSEAGKWIEKAEGHGNARVLRLAKPGNVDVDVAEILEDIDGDVHEHLHEHLRDAMKELENAKVMIRKLDLDDLDIDVDVDLEEILEESLGQIHGADGDIRVMVRGLDGLKGLEGLKGLDGLQNLKGLEVLKDLEELEELKVLGDLDGLGGAIRIEVDTDECDEEDEDEDEDVRVLRVGGRTIKIDGKDGNAFHFGHGDGQHGGIAIVRGDDGETREMKFGGNVFKLDGKDGNVFRLRGHDGGQHGGIAIVRGDDGETRELKIGGNVLKIDGKDGNVFQVQGHDGGQHGSIAIVRGEDGETRELKIGGNVLKLDDGEIANGRRVIRFGGEGDGPSGMAVIEVHGDDQHDGHAVPQRILRRLARPDGDAPQVVWHTRSVDDDESIFAEIVEESEEEAGDVKSEIEALRAEIKQLKQRLKELKKELKRGESA